MVSASQGNEVFERVLDNYVNATQFYYTPKAYAALVTSFRNAYASEVNPTPSQTTEKKPLIVVIREAYQNTVTESKCYGPGKFEQEWNTPSVPSDDFLVAHAAVIKEVEGIEKRIEEVAFPDIPKIILDVRSVARQKWTLGKKYADWNKTFASASRAFNMAAVVTWTAAAMIAAITASVVLLSTSASFVFTPALGLLCAAIILVPLAPPFICQAGILHTAKKLNELGFCLR